MGDMPIFHPFDSQWLNIKYLGKHGKQLWLCT